MDVRADFGVDGGQHLGELLDLGDASPQAVMASAISKPMYPAPTMTALAGVGLLERAHDGERVAHRVQQMDPVGGPELGPSPAIGGRTETAPVPTMSSS